MKDSKVLILLGVLMLLQSTAYSAPFVWMMYNAVSSKSILFLEAVYLTMILQGVVLIVFVLIQRRKK